MSLSAAALELLMTKGLTIADAVELAQVMEADNAPKAPSANAMRQRRFRDKKAEAVTNNAEVTRDSNDERVSPTPPSEITPIPPLKGGTFPKSEHHQPEKPAEPAKSISVWVSELWDLTPPSARARTSKPDIERSLKSAMRRDHDPADVVAGVSAYFDSPDATKDGAKFAKGTHRVIENDRWQAFEPELARPAAPTDPWPKRLNGFRANQYWHSDWGPKPGKPGCTVPTTALMTAGYQPSPHPPQSEEKSLEHS